MYRFSVYDMGATYGSQLQNLVYRNERKHSGGCKTLFLSASMAPFCSLSLTTYTCCSLYMIVQSTATDAHLTKTQKIVYGVVTVGGQYVMERVNGIVTEQGWGELPEVNKPGDRPEFISVPVNLLSQRLLRLTFSSNVNRTTSSARRGISFKKEQASSKSSRSSTFWHSCMPASK